MRVNPYQSPLSDDSDDEPRSLGDTIDRWSAACAAFASGTLLVAAAVQVIYETWFTAPPPSVRVAALAWLLCMLLGILAGCAFVVGIAILTEHKGVR